MIKKEILHSQDILLQQFYDVFAEITKYVPNKLANRLFQIVQLLVEKNK